MSIVEKAKEIALRAHEGQFRKWNNKPFFTHPERVALKVSEYCNDPIMIAAAYDHDVIEDCGQEWAKEIEDACGIDVLNLVIELTNIKHDKSIFRPKRKEMDRERLSKSSEKAKIIKMIDRMDNLNEMAGASTQFKKIYAFESWELLKVIGDANGNLQQQLKNTIEIFEKNI